MRTLKLGGRKRVSASIWRREYRFGDSITEPFLDWVVHNPDSSGTTEREFRSILLAGRKSCSNEHCNQRHHDTKSGCVSAGFRLIIGRVGIIGCV